nr:WecB/TagA/CpsF family glycosyltransferase [Eubacterium sp.]
MGTRIKIMDLELDLLAEETLEKEVIKYLSNDFLNVIHFISAEYIDTYDKNELVQETLAEADLVLPGEKTILSLFHVDVLETGGMMVDYHSALRLCNSKILGGKSCYLVLRSKKEARAIKGYLTKRCPFLKIVGVCTADEEMSEEALINDINTQVPDIIFLSLKNTDGEAWIHQNKGKLNAKLCVALGSMMDLMLGENVAVPQIFQTLHLDDIYRFVAKIPYSAYRRRRIFLKKMDNYNNKKLQEQADVSEELSDEGNQRE